MAATHGARRAEEAGAPPKRAARKTRGARPSRLDYERASAAGGLASARLQARARQGRSSKPWAQGSQLAADVTDSSQAEPRSKARATDGRWAGLQPPGGGVEGGAPKSGSAAGSASDAVPPAARKEG